MWHLAVPWYQLVIRSTLVYLGLLLGLRLFGKREVGQFTLFDLVLVLLAANAVQPAITGPDSSVLGGVIILATLFALNAVVARLDRRVPFLRRLTEGEATVIGRDGAWLAVALDRQGLSLAECEMALREHGLSDVRQVSLAVLETDGTISVVPSDAPMRRGRRRVRSRHL